MKWWQGIGAGLLVLTLAFGAPPRKMPEGMQLLRIQAGEPDAAGWVAATSTGGCFSVKLPAKFNDIAFTDPSPTSAVVKIFTIGGKTPDGVKYSATRMVYRDKAASQALFEKNVKTHKAITVGGHKAYELKNASNASAAIAHIILLDPDQLMLIVEAPKAQAKALETDAPTFFDSLVVQKP
jgi:hypothetical protein